MLAIILSDSLFLVLRSRTQNTIDSIDVEKSTNTFVYKYTDLRSLSKFFRLIYKN